jgi:hypothetical protein
VIDRTRLGLSGALRLSQISCGIPISSGWLMFRRGPKPQNALPDF